MTTRSPAAVARYFRRPYLEAFVKCNSSLDLKPRWASDFISRFSSAIDQGQGYFGHTFHLVILVRRNVQVSPVPRAGSQKPGLSMLPRHNVGPGGGLSWISTRALGQSLEVRRFSCSEILEPRGDNICAVENQENNAAEYRDLLRRRLESESHSSITFSSGPLFHSKLLRCQLMLVRNYATAPVVQGGRGMRITGTYVGPLASSCIRNPFLDGGVRFKSKKKMKKAKAKKKETLQKIKRMRMFSKMRKEEMNPEERLEFRIEKGRKKIELIKQAIAKFPVQEIPPEDPDIEVLTPEQVHYLKKIGYKNKNYVPVGRRGIYGGTVQNIHMHWKKHETVQVEIAGFSKEEIKVMAVQLARLSGGTVIDIHQNNIVILYRGRNYKMPKQLIPMKTLDKRKALAKSKLEQSMKALLENDKKVENELAALREENKLRLSGQVVEGGGQGSSIKAKKGMLEIETKLEDPDEYSEWSPSETVDDDDHDDNGSVPGLEVSDRMSSLSLESDSDSEPEGVYLEGDKAFVKSDDDDDNNGSLSDLEDSETKSSLSSKSDSDTDSEGVHLEGDKAIGK